MKKPILIWNIDKNRLLTARGGETMEDSTLVRKVRMSCPLCEKEHEVEERKSGFISVQMPMKMKMNFRLGR